MKRRLKGRSLFYIIISPLLLDKWQRKSKRGFAPLIKQSPSPLKERGTKGVRLINNLYLQDYSTKGVNGIMEL